MDRVELHREVGNEPLRAWRIDGVPYWAEATVSIGRLADGRWYGSHTGLPHSYAGTEGEVRAMVDDWLTDGEVWVPAPARYDADAKPADGLSWRKVGATWIPDE